MPIKSIASGIILSTPGSLTILKDMPAVWEHFVYYQDIHIMLPMATTPKMFANGTPSGLVTFIL